jgi:outer membrane receptor for ferrienterochelin and colicins
MKLLSLCLLLWVAGWSQGMAQSEIRGMVFDLDEEGVEEALAGVSVILLHAKIGTYTDATGHFKLAAAPGDTLVFRYISYEDDTLFVEAGKTYYRTVLTKPTTQATVEIRARIPASSYSMMEPQQVQLINRAELGRSACCNLGESFQANGSVDVTNTDAATGSREIRLLGLAGRYSQLLTEKRPMTRGLGAIYGLNYIPGDWIESIQISKGAGSVVDGYESMTGQINVEMRKPFNSDPLHLNLYINNFARSEANVVAAHQFSERLSTVLMAHGNINPGRRDPDADNFLNNPLGQAIIVQNRWHLQATQHFEMQAGAQYLHENRLGGQVSFDPNTDRGSASIWGLGVNSTQWSAFTKTGFTAKNRQFRSGGLILSGFQHDMDSYFGLRTYKGLQQNFRASFTFQDYIGDTRHVVRTGASWLYDGFHEKLQDSAYSRKENVPGLFAEYTWKPQDKFALVAGLRADQHNLFGTLITPRLHLRWNPWEKTSLRLSAGKGYRTPNPIAENIAVLASNRTVLVSQQPNQEKAWTFGIGLVQQFKIGDRDATLVIDAYRTQFTQRLVADLENAHTLEFYNISGGSFSNVAQIEMDVEVLPRLDVRLSWRMQDVRSTYKDVLLRMPLTPSQQGLINFSYKTKSEKWQGDLTLAYTGSQRLPNLSDNHAAHHFPANSPGYFRLNAQVTRHVQPSLELYLGGENLTNYMQHQPVIDATDPFGPNFDASVAWGPLMGAMGYFGLRWDLKKGKAK